jgi:hypothetical protein
MKTYKILNKFMWIVAGALLLCTACEDDIPGREPSSVTAANCQGVYFPSTNKATVELDPSVATEMEITIARTDSTGAVEVPIKADVNDGDVFVVPETVTFADGEKEATITVTFPSAEVGVAYNLKVSVSGDAFVNLYATGVPYLNTKVTRIAWTEVTPFVYVDGTFLAFYGVSQLPMYVHTEKAELGDIVRYRFKNAYGVATPGNWEGDEYIPEPDADGIYNGYPYNFPGDVDEDNDYYTVIEIDKDKKVSMAPCKLGVIWSYGMFSIGSIYGNLSDKIEDYPLGTFEAGEAGDIITFPANSLYISMANYSDGRKEPCGKPTVIYTTKEAYLAASRKLDDFNKAEYDDPIEGAVSEFESVAYSEGWLQTIAKAIDIDPKNEESEYKNLYYLANLYETGFGLAFYLKDDGAITVPSNQNTGRKAFGKEVYVSASDNIESKKTTNAKGVEVYTFGLKFHFGDGTVVGEFAETFYYSENPVTYEFADFLGDYTLTGPSAFGGYPDADMDVTIAAGDEDNTFVITGIEYAESVAATFNPETSVLSIAPQTLADFTMSGKTYDMALQTFAGEESSTVTPLEFTFNMRGQLVLTVESEVVGYLIYSVKVGGHVDGYSDLVFTPQTAAAAGSRAAASVAAARPLGKALNVPFAKPAQSVAAPATTQKCATHNFVLRGKSSAKTIKKQSLSRKL